MGDYGRNHSRALRTDFRLMVRLIALNAIFFLLPFAGYAAWLVATRGTTGGRRDWPARTIGYLDARRRACC